MTSTRSSAVFDQREDAIDRAVAAKVSARIAAGEEPVFPAEVVKRLDAGETPIKVFRDFRKLTQAQLAAASGLQQGYISELEAGLKTPSLDSLRALAGALAVDLELILPDEAPVRPTTPDPVKRRRRDLDI